jgi:YfiH family protein
MPLMELRSRNQIFAYYEKGMVIVMKFENNGLAQIDFSMEVPYITFPVLSDIPFIKHGFSTRLGGVSKGALGSMNLGVDFGENADDPLNIEENFRRIANSISIDPASIVVSAQVHKTNIRLVDADDCGKGLYRLRDYDEIDGLITNTPNVTLVTKYADCVPLLFADTRKKAIGLTHSGWRGTVHKIGKITVENMQEQFGSNPKDIIAVIGPSICRDCYEVGEETAWEFKTAFPNSADKSIIITNNSGRYQCDLWKANREVLLEGGLLPENITICGVCTSCHSDLLFSHRKSGGKRGSLAAFLAINQVT